MNTDRTHVLFFGMKYKSSEHDSSPMKLTLHVQCATTAVSTNDLRNKGKYNSVKAEYTNTSPKI